MLVAIYNACGIYVTFSSISHFSLLLKLQRINILSSIRSNLFTNFISIRLLQRKSLLLSASLDHFTTFFSCWKLLYLHAFLVLQHWHVQAYVHHIANIKQQLPLTPIDLLHSRGGSCHRECVDTCHLSLEGIFITSLLRHSVIYTTIVQYYSLSADTQ